MFQRSTRFVSSFRPFGWPHAERTPPRAPSAWDWALALLWIVATAVGSWLLGPAVLTSLICRASVRV